MQEEETIYSFMAEEGVTENKRERFISKFRECILEESRRFKYHHKTFGLPKELHPNPTNFLRKHGGVPHPKPKRDVSQRCYLKQRRAPLPQVPLKKDSAKYKWDQIQEWDSAWKEGRGARCPCPKSKNAKGKKVGEEEKVEKVERMVEQKTAAEKQKPQEVPKTQKDFVANNIQKAVHALPRFPASRFVDTKRGDLHQLKNSGLVPQFRLRKNFGRAPQYLLDRESVKDKTTNVQGSSAVQLHPFTYGHLGQATHYICAHEREQLLKGLKENWAELQRSLLKLPIQTDTTPRIRCKRELEENMRLLEQDIRTVERHKHIYVLKEGYALD